MNQVTEMKEQIIIFTQAVADMVHAGAGSQSASQIRSQGRSRLYAVR